MGITIDGNVIPPSIHNNTYHSTAYEDSLNKGVASGYASLDSNTKIPLSQLPDTTRQQTFVVLDNTARDGLTNLIEGEKCFVTSTGNSYIWDGTSWLLMADANWENVNLQWANIIDPPSTYAPSSHDNTADLTNYATASNLTAHDGSGGTAHTAVTTSVNGFMTSSDKTKLDGIATSANNYSLESHDNTHHSTNYATTSQLFSGSYTDLSNVPTSFTPSLHNNTAHSADFIVNSTALSITRAGDNNAVIIGVDGLDSNWGSGAHEGHFQGLSPVTGHGFLEVPWVYTNAIEANNKGSGTTGIYMGGHHGDYMTNYTETNNINIRTSGNDAININQNGDTTFFGSIKVGNFAFKINKNGSDGAGIINFKT